MNAAAVLQLNSCSRLLPEFSILQLYIQILSVEKHLLDSNFLVPFSEEINNLLWKVRNHNKIRASSEVSENAGFIKKDVFLKENLI